MNVPMPPRGYWASLAAAARAKAKYVRPPLTYTFAERMEEDHGVIAGSVMRSDADDLHQPVPDAPIFPETCEQAVARHAALATGLSRGYRPAGHHPIVQRLLEEDTVLPRVARNASAPQTQAHRRAPLVLTAVTD
jgi:hypothetical protein